MPRILRIINRFNLGGPTYNAAYLTRYMGNGYETLLVGGQKDETEDSSQFIVENLDISPVVIPEMRRAIHPFHDLTAFRKLKEIIGDYKPDIVHTHASKPGALGRWAAHQMGVPVIVHTFHGHVFHSYFNPAVTAFYKNLERRLARVSTCIVAISEKQKNELVHVHQICGAEKVAVVPLGFDLHKFQDDFSEKRHVFRTEFKLGDADVAVGIIGRLVPIKNHKLFLDAMAWVKPRMKQRTKAFVVGDGETRYELEAYCREVGLTCSNDSDEDVDVYFTSWVKKVDYVNAGVDIVALSSRNEGTPVSLIEAQAANRAIVSTKVGGIEDIVLPGKTALLSEPDDLGLFQENLLNLVNDKEMRDKLGENGWPFVKDKFHYERLVHDMTRLYDQLLA